MVDPGLEGMVSPGLGKIVCLNQIEMVGPYLAGKVGTAWQEWLAGWSRNGWHSMAGM